MEALSEALAAEELTVLHSMVDRDDVILDKRPKSTSFKPADEIVKFQVHPMDPTKIASIGTQLNPTIDAALREFLRENWDIFAWHPSDMPGIPRRLAEHSLNILKRIQAGQADSTALFRTQATSHVRRASQATRGRFHQRNKTSGLASKPGDGTKEGQILVHMHRFQGPQ